MQKVFLTEQIHSDAVELLQKNFEVVQGTSTAEDEIIRQAQGCAGILIRSAKITPRVMDGVPGLKVIAKHGIGVDNIDIPAATQRGILVVNAPLSNVNAVAEHTVALLLAAAKLIVPLDKMTRSGGFAKRTQYVTCELAGKTVGLVGFGRISSLVAKKLSALDVSLLTYDPFVSEEKAAALHVQPMELEPLLHQSDFVSLHTPLMPETEGMMNLSRFRQMKKTAWVINASRGPIVNEPDLVEALKTGVIAGAALDVFVQEPPAADNPLFFLDNVILSPHNAALSDRALWAMAWDSAEGVSDCLLGKTPRFPVNREVLEK